MLVDWDLAIKNVAENQSLLFNLLIKFIKDYSEGASQIKRWLQEGKMIQGQRQLLSLRATAGFIGALQLRKMAEDFEYQLRYSKTEALNLSWSRLESHLLDVIQEVQYFIKKNSAQID